MELTFNIHTFGLVVVAAALLYWITPLVKSLRTFCPALCSIIWHGRWYASRLGSITLGLAGMSFYLWQYATTGVWNMAIGESAAVDIVYIFCSVAACALAVVTIATTLIEGHSKRSKAC